MSLFCCSRPRSYSPTAEDERPISFTSSVPGGRASSRMHLLHTRRRESRHDIEAFYQEGKRLQHEEELRVLQEEFDRQCYRIPNSTQGGGREEEAEISGTGEEAKSVQCSVVVSPQTDDDPCVVRIWRVERNSFHTKEDSNTDISFVSALSHTNRPSSSAIVPFDFPSASSKNLQTTPSVRDEVGQSFPLDSIIANRYPSTSSISSSIVLPSKPVLRPCILPSVSTTISAVVSGSIRTRGSDRSLQNHLDRGVSYAEGIIEPTLWLPAEQSNEMAVAANTVGLYLTPGPISEGHQIKLDGDSTRDLVNPRLSLNNKPTVMENLFEKIPELTQPSTTSLAAGSTSQVVTIRGSPSYEKGCSDLESTITTGSSRSGAVPSSPPPCPRMINQYDSFIDNSSSYYPSENSTSTINLITFPVPPVPSHFQGCWSSPERKLTQLRTHSKGTYPVRNIPRIPLPQSITSSPEGLTPATPSSFNDYTNARNGRFSTSQEEDEDGEYTPWECASRNVIAKGSLASITYSSSIWGSGSPLLSQFPLEEAVPLGEISGQSHVTLRERRRAYQQLTGRSCAEDVKSWLREQEDVCFSDSLSMRRRSKSMTFKRSLTQSMIKLRSRMSGSLQPTKAGLTVPGSPVKGNIRDGRGDFARLRTPIDLESSYKDDPGTDFGKDDLANNTPHSEKTMAEIVFSPSLPEGLRQDGVPGDSKPNASGTTERSSSDATEDIPNSRDEALAMFEIPDTNRWSSTYDDCVSFPFANNPDDDEVSQTDSVLNTPYSLYLSDSGELSREENISAIAYPSDGSNPTVDLQGIYVH